VAGCKSVSGKVTLSVPAPDSGTSVTIADTLTSVTPPVSVTVPAGATSKSFAIKTVPVAIRESGTVSATVDSTTLSQPLAVRPMGLKSLTLSPATVVGSTPSAGTVNLECNAGPGPITVDLGSTDPAVAKPVATSIVIPVGLQSQPFDVTTNAVLSKTSVTIAGSANGILKSKALVVTPAAAVTPTSLKFGSVTVGRTSAPLNATLTNKGAAAFSVNSIGITGTYASWFAQTNNCPAILPAGASCTISVTFKPLATASKSAKLSVATSATSTPLGVSLSGTGL
jgi:hypothetical protein